MTGEDAFRQMQRFITDPSALPKELAAGLGERYACALYTTTDPTSELIDRLVGSGIYFEIEGEVHILTAEHVTTAARQRGLLCRAHENEWVLAGGFVRRHPSLDLALVHVGPPGALEAKRGAWSRERVAARLDEVERDFFLYGYPGATSRTSALLGGTISEAVALTLRRGPLSPEYSSEDHFAVEYPEDVITANFHAVDLPDAPGLSGSPIWRTNLRGNGRVWTPNRCELAGIAIAWDMARRTVIAVRAEAIRAFCRHVAIETIAFRLWRNRGGHHTGSLEDWLEAERRWEAKQGSSS